MSRSGPNRNDEAIWIPHGMIGFPGLTRYSLHSLGEEDVFHLLQSEEREQIRFTLIDPILLQPDYEVGLSPDRLEELEIENRADVRVFAVVTVPEDPKGMTVNFRAPLVVSGRSHVAMQIVLENENLPVRATLVEEWRREQAETVLI